MNYALGAQERVGQASILLVQRNSTVSVGNTICRVVSAGPIQAFTSLQPAYRYAHECAHLYFFVAPVLLEQAKWRDGYLSNCTANRRRYTGLNFVYVRRAIIRYLD